VSEPPTRVQASGDRRFSTLGVVLTGAAGFLAGILLVAALGGAKGRSTETVTVARTATVTVQAPVTNGGSVIVTTAVPDVTGQPLDIARERLARSGFETDIDGGGLFGVIEDSNWQVVEQSPPPGGQLEQGSTVSVVIERR
jgi:hypothetical protein